MYYCKNRAKLIIFNIMGPCCSIDRKTQFGPGKAKVRSQVNLGHCQDLINDSIFRNQTNAQELVKELIEHVLSKNKNKTRLSLERVFRGSENEFSAASFHSICQGRTHTIVIVQTTENRIFGGYTPCAWSKDEFYTYYQDKQAISFLFTIKDDKIQFFQIDKNQKDKSIMNHEESGPIFGQGHDLYISDECNRRESWNNIGKTYKSNFNYGNAESNIRLSREQTHLIKDYQVWQIF